MKDFILLVLCALVCPQFTSGHPPLQTETLRASLRRPLSETGIEGAEIGTFETIQPLYRLNDTFIPSKYELELTVLLDDDADIGEQFTCPGKVGINFKPGFLSSEIILHSNLLTLNHSSVQVTNLNIPGEVIGVTQIMYSNDDKHFVTINLDTMIMPQHEYKVYAEFVAPVNREELSGLYLSYYIDPQTNEERRLAATQMQAYHARQLFPSFDEPGLRATFDVTVIHKSNYSALGNSDILRLQNDSPRPGWTTTVFNPTVRMPTYLFALVVSDFKYVQAEPSLFKVPVRTYAPPPVIDRGGGDYSADVAARLLDFFDEYFATDYPMQKMDSVHVPQFDAGAMENWGLNLYREPYLIYYPEEHLESYKNLLTSVVSHELAHQNFGNRVTCKWWNELWLNEGFATYVSYLGVDAVRPEFRHREFILNDAVQYSMNYDLSPRTHPIVNDALSPSEVDLIFTGITYEKGGSINRMTENFLTEVTYQNGLRYYLANMSDSGVISYDLFHYLDVAAAEDARLPVGLTVRNILDSWVRQVSHPLVRVSVAPGGSSVFITQERYADLTSQKLWYVPVTVATQDNPSLGNLVPQLWLEEFNPVKQIPHDTSKWIMVNQNATGYYRVLYDEHLTSLIVAQLKENAHVIMPLSRSQLLDDYFNLAWLGHIDVETALDLTTYLSQEDHFTVWEVVFVHLRKAYTFAETDTAYSAFKGFLVSKVRSALDNVGLEQDNTEHVGALGILRSKLVDWACSLGESSCVAYAQTLYNQWKASPATNPVAVDIQSSVFCTIASIDAENGFNFLFEQYQNTPLGNPVKTRLLNSLACSTDPSTLQKLLDMTLDVNSGIHPSHALATIQRVAMNTAGRDLVLNFLQTNLQRIITVIGNGVSSVQSIVTTLASNVATQEGLDKLLVFISDNRITLESIMTPLNNHLNTIRANVAWQNRFGLPLINWMKNNPEPEVPTTQPPGGNADFLKCHGIILLIPFIKTMYQLLVE